MIKLRHFYVFFGADRQTDRQTRDTHKHTHGRQ